MTVPQPSTDFYPVSSLTSASHAFQCLVSVPITRSAGHAHATQQPCVFFRREIAHVALPPTNLVIPAVVYVSSGILAFTGWLGPVYLVASRPDRSWLYQSQPTPSGKECHALHI